MSIIIIIINIIIIIMIIISYLYLLLGRLSLSKWNSTYNCNGNCESRDDHSDCLILCVVGEVPEAQRTCGRCVCASVCVWVDVSILVLV